MFLKKDMPYQITEEFFVYMVSALAIVGLFSGRLVTRIIFSKLDKELSLVEKLKKYIKNHFGIHSIKAKGTVNSLAKCLFCMEVLSDYILRYRS